MMTIEKLKDLVAKEKGYPNWKEMYDFVARENQRPDVVAQLIEGAMQDVIDRLCPWLKKDPKGEPQFFVAEVSKSWNQDDAPVDILSERFERVINVNHARGYKLIDWQLSQILTSTLNETIIAVFEKFESK